MLVHRVQVLKREGMGLKTDFRRTSSYAK